MEIIENVWSWISNRTWWQLMVFMWALSMVVVSYAVITAKRDPNDKDDER